MAITVLAAQNPYSLAIVKNGELFLRTPTAPDNPMEWKGGDVEAMAAALVLKWGFYPVFDEHHKHPVIGDNEYAILKSEDHSERGKVWRVIEVMPMDDTQ